MQEVKEYVEKYSKLLPLNKSISTTDAEKKASMFLEVLATLANWKHLFTEDKIRCLSIQNAVYADELSKCTGKTVTENKVTVEASKEYSESREALERIDNDISYIRAYMDIFKDAHIFYRTMAKGEVI